MTTSWYLACPRENFFVTASKVESPSLQVIRMALQTVGCGSSVVVVVVVEVVGVVGVVHSNSSRSSGTSSPRCGS